MWDTKVHRQETELRIALTNECYFELFKQLFSGRTKALLNEVHIIFILLSGIRRDLPIIQRKYFELLTKTWENCMLAKVYWLVEIL